MKKYDTLTAGELRKCHGKKCRLKIDTGDIFKGKISVNKDGAIYVCHNNGNFYGGTADDKIGYDYSWCIYNNDRKNSYSSNSTYNSIEINL